MGGAMTHHTNDCCWKASRNECMGSKSFAVDSKGVCPSDGHRVYDHCAATENNTWPAAMQNGSERYRSLTL